MRCESCPFTEGGGVAFKRSAPDSALTLSYGDSFQLSQYQPRRHIVSEKSLKLDGLET